MLSMFNIIRTPTLLNRFLIPIKTDSKSWNHEFLKNNKIYLKKIPKKTLKNAQQKKIIQFQSENKSCKSVGKKQETETCEQVLWFFLIE